MQSLSESLHPYKEIIGQVASIVTIGQFFSGAFICKEIYEKGTTKNKSSLPFIGGIVVGILMLKYAAILSDPAMFQVNVAAIILNVIYLGFYSKYSEDLQEEVIKPISIGVVITAVYLGYAAVENPDNLEFTYGLLVTILMLILLGAPLKDLKAIIDSKDASSIPFPMTLMGVIVSFLWFIYGIILLNNFMIVQNLIGFSLCLVQLVLIKLYPGKQKKIKKNKKE